MFIRCLSFWNCWPYLVLGWCTNISCSSSKSPHRRTDVKGGSIARLWNKNAIVNSFRCISRMLCLHSQVKPLWVGWSCGCGGFGLMSIFKTFKANRTLEHTWICMHIHNIEHFMFAYELVVCEFIRTYENCVHKICKEYTQR